MNDPGDSATLASTLPESGRVIAGRYHVRRRLGRGGAKEVYLAYDERLDRDVAVALIVGAADGAAARARLEREARATGRLGDHPNVITVYDSGDVDGVPYLVLRAMPGGSLADARLPIADAIRAGLDVARALAHAHAHGVVHRDVKPDSIWLAADGTAALGDFGIAHEIGAERLTAEGVVVGTVRYLSPEQIRGDEIGPPSDVYALGVTLYELVAGRPPFTAEDPAQVIGQHLTAVAAPPSRYAPDTPPELDRLIGDLLDKHPARRPAPGEVAERLEAIRTGERPAAPAHRADARRLVSVLAARADVRDPEVLHGTLERCAGVIERHGGTVEQYLGDALVGLFGLSVSHGDDALRAARAAVELRSAGTGLRLGIEAGEVFLGAGPHGSTIATGAPITAAGRLAERAGEGEILLGGNLRAAIAAEASVDPVDARLLGLHEDQPALLRVPGTPFIGRARELEELRAAFARARDERTCRMVTLVGGAGMGKSRLAGELVAAVADGATVLAGRCPAYGEGTAYQALADIVRGLGGRRRLEALLAGDEPALRAILGAVGLTEEPAQADETAWALRRLLERLARDRPLVIAVEDIHWATPALLDLLDHVAELASGSAILLLCLARAELLEARPTWAAPRANRSIVLLEGLGAEDARELARRLGADGRAERIAQRADGNPLFVEQLVAVDEGQDLPASIQTVLAARIDRLEAGQRRLLQRASVEGRTFHAGALARMLDAVDRRGVGTGLVGLVRSGLIAADRPEFAGEDAFRFTHALIREAAYAGVPKLLRAELHTCLGGWLEGRPAAADEVVAHHFEEACRLAAELGGAVEPGVASRAVERFQAAARSALTRGDPAAASALLERAVALAEDAGSLLPALGASLFEAGRMTEATRVLDEAIARAPEPVLRARAQVEREFVRLETETSVATEQARRVADGLLGVLEREEDHHGQCRVWSLRAQLDWIAGRVRDADRAWLAAAECARRAGDERQLLGIVGWRATAAVLGPTPVDEAIRRCEAFRETVAASPTAVAWIVNPLASLHAMKGELGPAEAFLREANDILDQLGSLNASVPHHEGLVRLLAGQPGLAEAALRAGAQTLEAMSDAGPLATTTAMLAQAVYAQGRLEEARELCRAAARAAAPDDIVTQVIRRGVEARILARDGRCAEAEALAREAVALIEPTDLLCHRGDATLDLGDVLRTCGRTAEAEGAVRAGLSLHELKGNVAAAGRARRLLGGTPGGA